MNPENYYKIYTGDVRNVYLYSDVEKFIDELDDYVFQKLRAIIENIGDTQNTRNVHRLKPLPKLYKDELVYEIKITKPINIRIFGFFKKDFFCILPFEKKSNEIPKNIKKTIKARIKSALNELD